MSIIILHPDFTDPGGVASYYRKLKGLFTSPVEHYIVGMRPSEKGRARKMFRIIIDYARFFFRLKKGEIDIVHINPSLDPKSFIRDGLFLLLARLFKKKTIVFFRGWDKLFEARLEQKGLRLFKYFFGKTDIFIVLSEEFKRKLESWGCSQTIYCEVTVLDHQGFREFDLGKILSDRQKSQKWRILFLSRIENCKGIYETIQAFSLLQTKYSNMELIIAGDGSELENVKSFVQDRAITNIRFTGYVSGKDKQRIMERSHILCFPTYYGEGLPNTVIESMAFGLPVVTRSVGGLADFFENGNHGFITSSKKPCVIANLIEKLFLDGNLYNTMCLFNYKYAQSNFLPSDAALRLEQIYKEVLKD